MKNYSRKIRNVENAARSKKIKIVTVEIARTNGKSKCDKKASDMKMKIRITRAIE